MKKNRIAVMINSTMGVSIFKREIFGAEHIVIEGVGVIIGDSVMNGLLYPLEEVQKLAGENTGIIHAPVSHPVDKAGNFISASSPEGIQHGYIGAISYNYRMRGNLLITDIAINPILAKTKEEGREALRRLQNKEDTDVSTGLLLRIENKSGIGKDGEPHDGIARDIALDHVAILLNERGAATTLQGVGLFANSEGDKEEVTVATIETNAVMPAMRLPLADAGYQFNELEAVERIKEFTDSTTEPSYNYRRFFMNFDRNDVMNFNAYRLPFADIIDGVPYAIPMAIDNAEKSIKSNADDKDSAAVVAIAKVYKSKMVNSDKKPGGVANAIKACLQNLFSLVENSGSSLYNDFDNLDYDLKTNQEDRIMRDFIINKLKAMGINTDGLSDSDLQAKLNEALESKTETVTEKPVEKEVPNTDAITDAVTNALKPLQDKVNSLESKLNSDNELKANALATKVEGLQIGLNAERAKALGIDAMEEILKANGAEVNFNVNTSMPNKKFDGYSVPE